MTVKRIITSIGIGNEFKSILIVILIFVILFLCFYFPNKIAQLEYDNYSELVGDIQVKGDFYKSNMNLNYQMTGLSAPDVLCEERKNETKLLSELVKFKPLLIYRFTELHCNTCYETEIEALQAAFPDTSNLVSIICSYHIERDFIIFKKMNEIKIPLYRIEMDTLKWPAEKYSNPYYFVLHPDMKISHVYIPNKIYPEVNRQYLENVKHFLSKQIENFD